MPNCSSRPSVCRGIVTCLTLTLVVVLGACDSTPSSTSSSVLPRLSSTDAPTDVPVGALIGSSASVDTLRAEDFWTYKSDHTYGFENGKTEVTLLNLGARGPARHDKLFLRLPGFIPELGTYAPASAAGVDQKGRHASTFDATYAPTECARYVYGIDGFEGKAGTLTIKEAGSERVSGQFEVTLTRNRVGRSGICQERPIPEKPEAQKVRVVGRFSVAPDSVLDGDADPMLNDTKMRQ